MKNALIWCILVITNLSFAQVDSTVIHIHIIDEKDGEELKNVSVSAQQGSEIEYGTTSSSGDVFFKLESRKEVRLYCSNPQLEPLNKKLSAGEMREDTTFITLQMHFIRSLDLEGIVVAAPGVPTVVYKSPRLHVEDFEITHSGDIILLTYPKRLKKGSELLLFDGIKVKHSFQVPDVAEELVHDFRGNVHVLCEKNVFGIHPVGQRIEISNLPKDYFLKYVAPIIDTNRTKMYFSNFNPDYPAFDYFSFDQLDSVYCKLLSIEDELMMELYRSEYKWVDVRTKLWAKTKEMETGIDAEIWVGANYFTQSIYYKELYAPLFHRNDSLFVFDYYKDQLHIMNAVGEQLDSIPIYHHYRKKQTGWESQLIQDQVTGEIYALFDRHGYTYLGRIDVKDGEIKEQVRLEYRYVTKVQVYNNEVYYVYRPYESIQKKYLYKEKLPYSFVKSKVLPETESTVNVPLQE